LPAAEPPSDSPAYGTRREDIVNPRNELDEKLKESKQRIGNGSNITGRE
jgi:hypothetical protein